MATFDMLFLDQSLDICVAHLIEYESASVTTTQNILDMLSIEYWFNYFDYDITTSFDELLSDIGITVCAQYHFDGFWSAFLFQGVSDLVNDFGIFIGLIDYRSFYSVLALSTTIFGDTATFTLYSDFVYSIFDYYVSATYHGAGLTNTTVNVR